MVEPLMIIVGGSLPSRPPAHCASCHQWPESRAKSLPSREGCEPPGKAGENLVLPGGLSRCGERTQSRGWRLQARGPGCRSRGTPPTPSPTLCPQTCLGAVQGLGRLPALPHSQGWAHHRRVVEVGSSEPPPRVASRVTRRARGG